MRTIKLYLSDYLELIGDEYPKASICLLVSEPQFHGYLSMGRTHRAKQAV